MRFTRTDKSTFTRQTSEEVGHEIRRQEADVVGAMLRTGTIEKMRADIAPATLLCEHSQVNNPRHIVAETPYQTGT